MSQQNNDPPGKVVDLHGRGQGGTGNSTERGGELIRTCRKIAQKRLGEGLGAMFEKVDDALFDMAEKAENSTRQADLFEGMREVRKKRPVMERVFQEELGKVAADLASAISSGAEISKSKNRPAAKEGLSLVADEELEEDLAIDAMVGKADNRLARPLYALQQRLSVLFGGSKIDIDNNPLGPAAVCEAFRRSIALLQSEINVKLLILKLFEKHALSNLDPLYDELNLKLIEAGVLPQLKHQVSAATRPGGSSAAPSGYSQGAIEPDTPDQVPPSAGPMAGANYAPAYSGAGFNPEMAIQFEILNTLRGLLSARRQEHYGHSQPSGPSFATSDLLNALSVLQAQGHSGAPAGMSQLGNAAQAPVIPLAELKQEITEKLAHLGTKTDGHQMAAADEDTIDLVGMLFEFILQDRNLPSQVQAILARLQIPYLKAAILDKEMFARPDHPARLLLDELAKLGLGWSEEADRDGRIFGKIREVVEALLKDFDEDVGIFQRMLDNLQNFNQGHQKRAEVAEQRTAETTKGKEKLQAARKNAAKEILQRIEDKALPEVIRNLLTRPWANVIVLTILRQGENSHQWRTSLRIADELVWSSEPKRFDAERNRLRALIPELEKALRQGLSMVAYHEHDIDQLLAELRHFFNMQLDPTADPSSLLKKADRVAEAPAEDYPPGTTAPAADGSSESAADGSGVALVIEEKPPAPAASKEESFVEEIARQADKEESDSQVETELIEDEHYRGAREIKVGTWVEFRTQDDKVERAKLSWISPISAKYLFVNRKGLKVADKTVLGLAHELRLGRAMILEDVPLFDRALDAIVERLKNSVPASEGEGGADPT
jgi:hypothetical protein